MCEVWREMSLLAIARLVRLHQRVQIEKPNQGRRRRQKRGINPTAFLSEFPSDLSSSFMKYGFDEVVSVGFNNPTGKINRNFRREIYYYGRESFRRSGRRKVQRKSEAPKRAV
ncbi:hypothetical protein PIB30_098226 [Stylosanthes scabra]|uniref:Uncharacterized protein n=1 Tax=Stylosanthes scabra TaxID=79078 RepID=A0ABU6SYX5_9FABA|nr:hypothetical protein [Stylosanthes scabra]